MGRLKKDLQQIKLSQGQTSPLPLVSPEKEFSTAEQNRRRKMPSLKITFKKSQPEGRFNTCAPSLSMSTLPSTYTTSLSASSYQNSPSSPSRVYLKPKTRKPIILGSEKKEAMNLVDLRQKDQLNAWEKPLRMVQRELSETPPLIISLPKDEIYNSESSPETEKPTSSLTNCASVQYCPGGEASKGEKDKKGQNQKTSVTSNHWRAWDRSNSPAALHSPRLPTSCAPLTPPILSTSSKSSTPPPGKHFRAFWVALLVTYPGTRQNFLFLWEASGSVQLKTTQLQHSLLLFSPLSPCFNPCCTVKKMRCLLLSLPASSTFSPPNPEQRSH